jgi:hypothetical protein
MTTTEMAARILGEHVLGLSQAANRIPAHRGRGRISAATVWRWAHVGVTTQDGRKVHLEAIRLGGRWVTSVEALARFAAAQTPQADAKHVPTSPLPTPTRRQRAAQRAGEALDQLGF